MLWLKLLKRKLHSFLLVLKAQEDFLSFFYSTLFQSSIHQARSLTHLNQFSRINSLVTADLFPCQQYIRYFLFLSSSKICFEKPSVQKIIWDCSSEITQYSCSSSGVLISIRTVFHEPSSKENSSIPICQKFPARGSIISLGMLSFQAILLAVIS